MTLEELEAEVDFALLRAALTSTCDLQYLIGFSTALYDVKLLLEGKQPLTKRFWEDGFIRVKSRHPPFKPEW